jgi:hypothetical protein
MSSLAQDCVDDFDDTTVEIIFSISSFVLKISIYITAGCLVLIPLILAILVSSIYFKFRNIQENEHVYKIL